MNQQLAYILWILSILLLLLDRIVDSGNTVVIVEHNQQIINAADLDR